MTHFSRLMATMCICTVCDFSTVYKKLFVCLFFKATRCFASKNVGGNFKFFSKLLAVSTNGNAAKEEN